jgi:heme-degrading monooxygenase HmoA
LCAHASYKNPTLTANLKLLTLTIVTVYSPSDERTATGEMTITELALLRLSPNVTIEDANLRANLSHAKTAMQEYTGRVFYYFQQTEDPTLVYVVGEWESLDQHMNGFIPSEQNQALLGSLKDSMSVEWLLHADVPHAELPLPKSDAERAKALRGESVISIARHFVKPGAKGAFQQTFESNKQHLQDYLTEGTMGGGWRIDRNDGEKEWVLVCPYSSVQQHMDFAETAGFEKYGRIREHMDGAEIKHAKLLDI